MRRNEREITYEKKQKKEEQPKVKHKVHPKGREKRKKD